MRFRSIVLAMVPAIVPAILLAAALAVPGAARADVGVARLAPHEGKTVSRIVISGNAVTRRYVIAREIETAVGDSLRVATVEADHVRLENLGIFASIDIVLTDLGNAVALEYRVREMPWIIPYIKFRYTEQDGWSLGPAVSSINLFGLGIRVSGNYLAGANSQFTLGLTWPWITGDHVSAEFHAARLFRKDSLNEFDETSDETTAWMGRYLGRNGRLRGGLSYFRMQADRDGVTLTSNNDDRFFRAALSLGIDTRDSWRNPRSGWWSEALAVRTWGDGNWWLGELDIRRYQPTWPSQGLVLGILASLNSGQVGVDFPGYLQYRLGGANSVRGYDIEKLGKELFGQNQFLTTAEYRVVAIDLQSFPVLKWAVSAGLSLAVFADYGHAWNGSDLPDGGGKWGYGTGLRFLVPGVDMIRTDVAVGDDGVVYFHLGVWDKLAAQRERLR
ncbi:MAG: BamA/TamA family outer membrane protein [Candidatus Krumholzibacteria bacterium]|nr:BamA/TamA family outer membrane protein [Candidatus Krumholzibacteria bacterium]